MGRHPQALPVDEDVVRHTGGGGAFDRRSTAERDDNRAAQHEDDGIAQRAEGRGGNGMDMFAVL